MDSVRAKLEATRHEANARVEEVRGQLEAESSEARQRHEAMLRQMQDNLSDSEGCYQALATYKDALVGEVAGLKETVRLMKLQKLDHEDHIRWDSEHQCPLLLIWFNSNPSMDK